MTSDEHPRYRRSRTVTAVADAGHGLINDQLECGHVTRRRPLCNPTRAICREC